MGGYLACGSPRAHRSHSARQVDPFLRCDPLERTARLSDVIPSGGVSAPSAITRTAPRVAGQINPLSVLGHLATAQRQRRVRRRSDLVPRAVLVSDPTHAATSRLGNTWSHSRQPASMFSSSSVQRRAMAVSLLTCVGCSPRMWPICFDVYPALDSP